MTTFAQAQTILDTAIDAVAGIPTVTKENERIKTSTTTSFARSTLAPAATIQESIGSCGIDRINGLYVVDIFYPKDVGVSDPNADVDAVVSAFESGTILTDGVNKVEIFNSYPNPSVADLDKFYRKQIVIEWRARKFRTA